MESMANTATVWNGCSSQGCLRCLWQKSLNQLWWHGARIVCVSVLCRRQDLTSSFKTCMWWRRHTEVSRLFSSIRIEFHCILNLISFYSYLLLYGKSYFFTNRIVLFNSFFFLRKQKYAFFFSFCSVNSLSRWNRQGPLQIQTSAWNRQNRWT